MTAKDHLMGYIPPTADPQLNDREKWDSPKPSVRAHLETAAMREALCQIIRRSGELPPMAKPQPVRWPDGTLALVEREDCKGRTAPPVRQSLQGWMFNGDLAAAMVAEMGHTEAKVNVIFNAQPQETRSGKDATKANLTRYAEQGYRIEYLLSGCWQRSRITPLGEHYNPGLLYRVIDQTD